MVDLLGKTRFDPLDYVDSLGSPIGVYLKREVFGKRPSSALTNELREKIVAAQSEDGSWEQMFVYTANSLWNLYLLGCDAEDPYVKKGLDWLRSIGGHQYHGLPGFFYSSNRRDPSTMRATLYGEFGPGCSNFYQTTYAVHLFHIFGLDEEVEKTIESYLNIWGEKGEYCGVWCTLNVLRILIEHPLSKDSRQVEKGLEVLAEMQNRAGSWERGKQRYPFYYTFHELSRSSHKSAKEQLETALPLVLKRQNKDGSWGTKAQQTNTYLALDGLRNMSGNFSYGAQ